MEHLALWIYFIGMVDNLCGVLIVFGVLFTFATLIIIILLIVHNFSCNDNEHSEKYRIFRKYAYIFGFMAFLCNGAAIAIPSSKTLAAIIVIPAIAQNKDMQKLPADMAHTLENLVVSWGKDLAPKIENKN